MKIRDFLKTRKTKGVITVKPDDTEHSALQKLVENNIGALPVCNENGELLGILSERDLLKEWLRRGDSIGSTKVEELMTRNVAVAHLDDELDYAAAVMKKKGIRHLPVVTGQTVESILSMRDVVGEILAEVEAEVRYVEFLKSHRGRPY